MRKKSTKITGKLHIQIVNTWWNMHKLKGNRFPISLLTWVAGVLLCRCQGCASENLKNSFSLWRVCASLVNCLFWSFVELYTLISCAVAATVSPDSVKLLVCASSPKVEITFTIVCCEAVCRFVTSFLRLFATCAWKIPKTAPIKPKSAVSSVITLFGCFGFIFWFHCCTSSFSLGDCNL